MHRTKILSAQNDVMQLTQHFSTHRWRVVTSQQMQNKIPNQEGRRKNSEERKAEEERYNHQVFSLEERNSDVSSLGAESLTSPEKLHYFLRITERWK